MRAASTGRKLRNSAQRVLHRAFVSGQRFGVDVLPRHFYSSIPDIQQLRADDSWKAPRSMAGVNGVDSDRQIEQLRAWCEPVAEHLGVDGAIHARACVANGTDGYGRVESDVLFAFVATQRPKKVVQIGCGVSTAVILNAAAASGHRSEIVCIEPFPNDYLKRAASEKQITLLPRRAQEIELGVLTGIGKDDLLFVDSTHTVKPGSEVNQVILEVLPRLAPGCFVHFHDIVFPYDYQPSVLTTLFFSAESTLLHAFLACNPRFEIAVSLSMLHHARSSELQRLLPGYRPAPMDYGLHRGHADGDFPSATYLRVIG